MPITEELKNVKNFESVGFSHDQSETLADVIEQSHTQSQESLKEFIRSEINGLNTKIDSLETGLNTKIDSLETGLNGKIDYLKTELNGKIDYLKTELNGKIDYLKTELDGKIDVLRFELKADIEGSSKDLLIKIFAIVFGTSGMLFAMIKLFG